MFENATMVNGVEYQLSKRVPLMYSLTDVDNLDYKFRSGFRSVRNLSHITSTEKHLVEVMSPKLGKVVVCHHRGKFFITKPNETDDGLNIEDVTDLVIAVADLI